MLRHRLERLVTYHLSERLPQAALGALRGNAMPAYWYRETVNFGDLLTPVILRHHGFTPVHAYPAHARLAATGSILEHLAPDFGGVILGSGFIDAASRAAFPRAHVLAVRGALTRARIDGHGSDIALGDPGLYAARLMGGRVDPDVPLGLIPHHSNLGAPGIARIKARLGNECLVISPVAQPGEVFAQIRRCALIVSSSLHGLILADALGIPSVWSAETTLLGGTFKFHDYASAVGRRDWAPVTLTGDETLADLSALASCAPQDKVAECQASLARCFEQFAQRARDNR